MEISGKSRATFYRHLKNGRPVKQPNPWMTLGISRATFYRQLKKTPPEAPLPFPIASIPPESFVYAPTKIKPSTALEVEFARAAEAYERRKRG
jgi:predicted DNA-binding transcriptional regulator AlpA